jgi:DNA-binding PadR family transcriptional regulator
MLSSYATGSARCARSEPFDPADALRRAMSAMREAHDERGGRGEGGHRHRRHRHRGFGGGPEGFGFGGFGGFGPGGPGGPRGRARKARRGDIRTAALLLLNEEPRNGYQIMQELEQRTDGVWRPSPGSVYPALQQLEDERLIRSTESDGRKLFEITDDGRALVAKRPDDATAPWEQWREVVDEDVHQLFGLMRQLAAAFTQVMSTGSKAQIAKAHDVLDTARRELYRILADGEDAGEPDGENS